MMSESDQSTKRSGDKLKCADASAVSPREAFLLFELASRLGLSRQVRRTKKEKMVEKLADGSMSVHSQARSHAWWRDENPWCARQCRESW